MNGDSNGIERERPEQVEHGDPVVHRQPDARRVRREVRRPEHAIRAGEVRREARLAPGPVPERDHVGAAREQLVRELRGDAAARGGVLAVDDAEVGAELFAKRRQPRLDRPSTGCAEHVGDEEDAAAQPSDSVAAG